MANPSAPTNVSATRVNDSKATIAWTNNSGSSAAAKYTKLRVYMYDASDTAVIQYQDITYSGQASYTLNWIWSDGGFRFRVRAYNASGGYATSGYSNTIYTTPAAPSSLKGTFNEGSVSVNLTWRNNSIYVDGYYLDRYHADTDTWDTVTLGDVVSYTDTSPYLGSTVKYRIRAFVGTLASAYSNTATVAQLAAPNPPTITAPDNGQVLESSEQVTLRWVYNSTDGTAQRQINYVVANNPDFTGGTQASTITNSDSANIAVSMLYSGINYVQLRARGLYTGGDNDGWSDWAQVSFYRYPAPIVQVWEPTDESTVTALPLTVTLRYQQQQAQPLVNYQVSIRQNGEQVAFAESSESITPTGNPPHANIDVPFEGFIPENDSEFTIYAAVTASSGFSASNESSFATDYTPPAAPVVTVVQTDGCSATITVADGGGEVTADSFTIVRSDGVTVAQGLSSGDTFTDYIPPIDQEVVYTVYAYAIGGAASSANASLTVESDGSLYINHGQGFAQCTLVQMDLSWQDGTSHKRGLYEVRGSRDPVVRTTKYRTRTITATGTLWNKGPGQDLSALRDISGTVYLRVPMGDVIPCVMDVSETFAKGKPIDTVDIKFTQVGV